MEINKEMFEKLKDGKIWISNGRLFKFDKDSMDILHHFQSLICPDEPLIDGNSLCYQFRKRSDGSIYWIERFGKAEYEVHINEYFIHRCEKCNKPKEIMFSGGVRNCRFCTSNAY
jgi:hypothetical protein